MKKILIMCNTDPNTSPRPNRMARWLKDEYQVTVVARQELRIAGLANSFVIAPEGLFGTLAKGKKSIVKLKELLRRLVMFTKKDYEGMIWASIGSPSDLLQRLARENFDLIITHDCTLLPLAFSVKGEKPVKVMLDAREYYPRNFDDQWLWRVFVRPINEYLCEHYLSRCNKIITVSDGLAREYNKAYQIDPEVIMSMPPAQEMPLVPAQPGRIRLIHHGQANSSRRLELMIEMMDFLDERFSLDLMLVGDGRYLEKLRRLTLRGKNVKIIPPVPMKDIVPFINQYDVGLYLVQPSNFNIEYMLPNKLFEFIQARLVVAIGPSIDMKKIVEKYDCGIVSQDFSPQSLAQELNKLTPERIMDLKRKSHQAAMQLNAEANGKRIHEIVEDLVGNNT
ncbi:MAG: glycosyltransferase [Anaerolineales bacterium]|nr:glycosyltransferase [Anaerolineales bacterium]